MKSAISARSASGLGDVGQPLLRLAAVVFELEHVLEHRKAAFGARDAEALHEAQAVAPAGERLLQPGDVFGDDLGDDAVPVERRAVVAHEDFEPAQRRRDGREICAAASFSGSWALVTLPAWGGRSAKRSAAAVHASDLNPPVSPMSLAAGADLAQGE